MKPTKLIETLTSLSLDQQLQELKKIINTHEIDDILILSR